MRRLVPLASVLAVLSFGSAQVMAQESDELSPEAKKFAEVVSIEFPMAGYTFTLQEAAKGIKLPYKFVVAENVKGVIPLRFGPSFAEPLGKSGLFPREEISGNEQIYCLCDFGAGKPPSEEDEVVTALKKGSYQHEFEWDGLNWTGPSDTGLPKGDPFPAGTYEVKVTIHGKLLTERGKVPYQIVGKTKLVLK